MSTQTNQHTAQANRLAYLAALAAALLLAVVSVAGLSAQIYPTEDLRFSFLANDLVSLVVGLPVVMGALWSAWRGQLIGRLFLPGALYFIVYTYTVHLFAMPLNAFYVLYLVLLAVSLYSMVTLLATMDSTAVQRRLRGAVPERLAGGVLMMLGILFGARAVGEIINAANSATALSAGDRGLNVTDFLLAGAWIFGGVLLWRRQAAGYLVAPGLLYQACALFVGVIMLLIVRPLLLNTPFIVDEVIVLAVMAVVCFIPFVMLLRGIMAQSDPHNLRR